MKKYVPSIKTNNQIKEEFLKSLNLIIYKSKKGKINPNLDFNDINSIVSIISNKVDELSDSLGTGKEDVFEISKLSYEYANNFKNNLQKNLYTDVKDSALDLAYYLEYWKEILNGSIVFDPNEIKKDEKNRHKNKLMSRLSELNDLKELYSENERRLEKDILLLEKNKSELDERIINESNERSINDLYRQISAIVSKLDSLNIRKSNYSGCYNLLDLIYSNAKEVVLSLDLNAKNYKKAKVLLNLDKLRSVSNEPEKAIRLLKRMDIEVKEMVEKTTVIDLKILDTNKNSVKLTKEANDYKAQLLKAKEGASKLNKTIKGE